MVKIRSASKLSLQTERSNLIITYSKGVSLANVFYDIIPLLINDIGVDEMIAQINIAADNAKKRLAQ